MNERRAMLLRTLRQGALAGLVAGLVVALLLIVDYGPGSSLRAIARWFALDTPGTGRIVGFLLMLLLGAVFGLLFGLIVERWQPRLGRWLLTGLALGLLWWVLGALVFGVAINHVGIDVNSVFFYVMMLLVYGLLLGSLAFQWRQPQA